MTQQETRTEGVDAAWAAGFAQEWLGAWNSHEPDRLLALMTDDIVYEDTAWPTTMHGHADVRAFLDHVWRGIPDMRVEIHASSSTWARSSASSASCPRRAAARRS